MEVRDQLPKGAAVPMLTRLNETHSGSGRGGKQEVIASDENRAPTDQPSASEP
jgi:hypothetical protein